MVTALNEAAQAKPDAVIALTADSGCKPTMLTAKQIGYRAGSATFTAAAGPGSEVSLDLARTSAVLSIVTAPPDVEVIVDGVSRGRTASGPPAGDYAQSAARALLENTTLSARDIVERALARIVRDRLRRRQEEVAAIRRGVGE